MAHFYPETKRLFDNLRGRKAKYTPESIAKEFLLYIEDLKENPIEIDTEYKYQSDENGERQNRRTQSIARPPKITDFVVRWLGMTHQWWYALPNGKIGEEYRAIIERITRYCYDVKFDGAVVGIYNVNIIARDLGLKENVALLFA